MLDENKLNSILLEIKENDIDYGFLESKLMELDNNSKFYIITELLWEEWYTIHHREHILSLLKILTKCYNV